MSLGTRTKKPPTLCALREAEDEGELGTTREGSSQLGDWQDCFTTIHALSRHPVS